MPAYVISGMNDASQFASASPPVTYTVDAGTGTDRVLYVWLYWRNRAQSITGITYDGVAMTSLGAQVANGTTGYLSQLWRLVAPASGSNTLSVQPGLNGVGNAPVVMAWFVADDVDQTTPEDGYDSDTGSSASANAVSSLTIASATGDLPLVFHTIHGASTTSTATNFTERASDDNHPWSGATTCGDGTGAASVATSVTWGNGAVATQWLAMGCNLKAAGGGGGGGFQSAWARGSNVVIQRAA